VRPIEALPLIVVSRLGGVRGVLAAAVHPQQVFHLAQLPPRAALCPRRRSNERALGTSPDRKGSPLRDDTAGDAVQ
jgi:hypothetical protein